MHFQIVLFECKLKRFHLIQAVQVGSHLHQNLRVGKLTFSDFELFVVMLIKLIIFCLLCLHTVSLVCCFCFCNTWRFSVIALEQFDSWYTHVNIINSITIGASKGSRLITYISPDLFWRIDWADILLGTVGALPCFKLTRFELIIFF